MLIKVRMAIMSHLSDAQRLMAHDPGTAGMHVNFAKLLLVRYDDIDSEVADDELTDIWMNEIYNKNVQK